jgi:hypothetical protein
LVTLLIGTAELMVLGILELIAADKEVSIGTAGYLVAVLAALIVTAGTLPAAWASNLLRTPGARPANRIETPPGEPDRDRDREVPDHLADARPA